MSIKGTDEEKAAALAEAEERKKPKPGDPGNPVVIGPRSFEFGGHEYEFDPQTISVDALEAIDEQRYVLALRDILGPEQWADYKSRHPLASDLERFLQAMFAAAEG